MHQSAEVTQSYRFGVFELNERAHELRKQGHRIRLQDQPFQILRLLLQRAGDIVTRDELRQNLWPSSVYVDFDHGLNNAIARVRDALDDTAATPKFIETLPRLGYRFIYPVERVPVAARVSRDERATETAAAERIVVATGRHDTTLVAASSNIDLCIGRTAGRRRPVCRTKAD